MNKQPICANPKDARVCSASGYTLCANCPNDLILGPAWHPSNDFPSSKIGGGKPEAETITVNADLWHDMRFLVQGLAIMGTLKHDHSELHEGVIALARRLDITDPVIVIQNEVGHIGTKRSNFVATRGTK